MVELDLLQVALEGEIRVLLGPLPLFLGRVCSTIGFHQAADALDAGGKGHALAGGQAAKGTLLRASPNGSHGVGGICLTGGGSCILHGGRGGHHLTLGAPCAPHGAAGGLGRAEAAEAATQGAGEGAGQGIFLEVTPRDQGTNGTDCRADHGANGHANGHGCYSGQCHRSNDGTSGKISGASRYDGNENRHYCSSRIR